MRTGFHLLAFVIGVRDPGCAIADPGSEPDELTPSFAGRSPVTNSLISSDNFPNATLFVDSRFWSLRFILYKFVSMPSAHTGNDVSMR